MSTTSSPRLELDSVPGSKQGTPRAEITDSAARKPFPLDRGLSKMSLGRMSFDSMDFGSELAEEDAEAMNAAVESDLLQQLGVSSDFIQQKLEEEERRKKEEEERLKREEEERLKREEEEKLRKEEEEREKLKKEEEERQRLADEEKQKDLDRQRKEEEERQRLADEEKQKDLDRQRKEEEERKKKEEEDKKARSVSFQPDEGGKSPQAGTTASNSSSGSGTSSSSSASSSSTSGSSASSSSTSASSAPASSAPASSAPAATNSDNTSSGSSSSANAGASNSSAGGHQKSASQGATAATGDSSSAGASQSNDKSGSNGSNKRPATSPKTQSQTQGEKSSGSASNQHRSPTKSQGQAAQKKNPRVATKTVDDELPPASKEKVSRLATIRALLQSLTSQAAAGNLRPEVLATLQKLLTQSAHQLMQQYEVFSAQLKAATKKQPATSATGEPSDGTSTTANSDAHSNSQPATQGDSANSTTSTSSSSNAAQQRDRKEKQAANSASEEATVRRYDAIRRELELQMMRLGDLEFSIKSHVAATMVGIRRAHERLHARVVAELQQRGAHASEDGREWAIESRRDAMREEADRCVTIAAKIKDVSELLEAAGTLTAADALHVFEQADVQLLLSRVSHVAMQASNALPHVADEKEKIGKLEMYAQRSMQLRHRVEELRSLERWVSSIHEMEKGVEYVEPLRKQGMIVFSPIAVGSTDAGSNGGARFPKLANGQSQAPNKSSPQNGSPANHQNSPDASRRRKQTSVQTASREQVRTNVGLVHGLAVAPTNPRKIASCGSDLIVRTYHTNGDGRSPEPSRECVLQGSTAEPVAVQFHPLTHDVLAVLYHSTVSAIICLWNVSANYGEQLSVLKRPAWMQEFRDFPVNCMTFTSDGEFILLGSFRSVAVLSCQTQTTVRIIEAAHAARVSCLAAHPLDASLFASGADDGEIKLWDLSSGSCVMKCRASRSFTSVCGLCFTQDADVLLASTMDGAVMAFRVQISASSASDVISSTLVRFESYPQPSACLAVAGAYFGQGVILVGYQNGSLCMYTFDPETFEPGSVLRVTGFTGSVRSVLAIAPLRSIWAASADGKIYLFALKTLLAKVDHSHSRGGSSVPV